MSTARRHIWVVLVALIAITGLLAGCGSSGGDSARADRASNPATSTDSAGSTDSVSTKGVTLRVGDLASQLKLPFDVSGQGANTPYKLSWSTFASGPELNAALASGKIDVGGFVGETPTLLALGADTAPQVIASKLIHPDGYFRIVAPRASGIATVKDLKGKRIASVEGTAFQGYLLQALFQAGITQNDVTVVNVPSNALLTTLESGAVDAGVIGGPTLTYLAAHPDTVTIATNNASYSTILASKKALADPAKRAALLDFVTRGTKADQWVQAHPDEWKQRWYVETLHQTEKNADFLQKAEGAYNGYGTVTPQVADHVAQLATLLQSSGVLAKGIDSADLFDKGVTAKFNAAIENALRGPG